MEFIKPAVGPEPIDVLSRWKEGYTRGMIIFGIVTVILTTVVILLFSLGSLKEISENFPRYRCNPIIMPFASSFGYDTKENFNFCLTTIFNSKASEIFGPIYTLLSGFTDIMKLIVDATMGIRKLFSNFLFGVNNFVRSIRDRIQGLLFNIRMSFLKLNNLMGRVFGTMYAVIWMGTSALTAGFNLSDNSLVQFLFAFCFDPRTPIPMANGTVKPLHDVVIGDVLAPVRGVGGSSGSSGGSSSGSSGSSSEEPPVVTSVFRFSGTHTPMVTIQGIHVSAEHYVQYREHWIPAREHPEAVPSPSLPELICLNVRGHEFRVGDGAEQNTLVVADYDEHSSTHVIHRTQNIALRALNGAPASRDAPLDDYSLGIDGNFAVRMKDDTWKPIHRITVGETVWNAGLVHGVVQELCDQTVEIDGCRLAVAQSIFDSHVRQWRRAVYSSARRDSSVSNNPVQLYSIITETTGTLHVRAPNGAEYFLRDYREVALPEMEDAYTEEFGNSATTSRSMTAVLAAVAAAV